MMNNPGAIERVDQAVYGVVSAVTDLRNAAKQYPGLVRDEAARLSEAADLLSELLAAIQSKEAAE